MVVYRKHFAELLDRKQESMQLQKCMIRPFKYSNIRVLMNMLSFQMRHRQQESRSISIGTHYWFLFCDDRNTIRFLFEEYSTKNACL